MPQMYHVRFTRTGVGTVETGDAILNADTREHAISITTLMCNLPASGTQFDVERVKPAFYLARRANVERHISTYEAMTVTESNASSATFPRGDSPDRERFVVSVRAELHADSETDAVMSAARAMARHATGSKQRLSLRSFDIACDPVPKDDHVSRYDENAGYAVHNFVSGGAVRPR